MSIVHRKLKQDEEETRHFVSIIHWKLKSVHKTRYRGDQVLHVCNILYTPEPNQRTGCRGEQTMALHDYYTPITET